MKEILNNGNVIYAYKRISDNKIVYVGQTIDLKTRHKQHVYYDPYNINTREYEYPLSRGIRKYGENAYELIVLEDNVEKEELNNREKYWINYYNTYWDGYNQTIGGTFPTKPIFTNEQIQTVIKMLKQEEFSYNDIMQKTGISLTHIYNINIGARRRQDNLTYPIRPINTKGTRGIKFSKEQCLQIHNELLNTNKSMTEIAKYYKCSLTTIQDINQGNIDAYKYKQYSYPLRQHSISIGKQKLTLAQNEEIHKLILNTSLTFTKIAKQFNCSSNIISYINQGKHGHNLPNYTYPLRNKKIK